MNESKSYTREEINQAYRKLIEVRGLVDFVLLAGLDISKERCAEIEGSLTSIFSIIQDYLEEAAGVMSRLDMGFEGAFAALWKTKKESEE